MYDEFYIQIMYSK